MPINGSNRVESSPEAILQEERLWPVGDVDMKLVSPEKKLRWFSTINGPAIMRLETRVERLMGDNLPQGDL